MKQVHALSKGHTWVSKVAFFCFSLSLKRFCARLHAGLRSSEEIMT